VPVVGVRPFLTHGANILHHSYADVDQEVELGNFKRVCEIITPKKRGGDAKGKREAERVAGETRKRNERCKREGRKERMA